MNRTRTLGTTVVLALVLVLVAGLSVQLPQGAAHAQDPEREPAPQQASAPQAPLGTAFTYQGQLSDGGSLADGEYDFRFTLHDDPTANSPVAGPVAFEDLYVDGGLFTVQLDFGQVFTGDARYLEIEVREGSSSGGYTSLLPRPPLTAAPYALYATAAPWSGLAGVPAGFADNVDDDTTYSPGFGLDLLGSTFHVVTSTIQQRVAATCGAGSAIRVVNPDGTVVCEPTGASTGFWSLTGNAGTTPGTHFLGTTDGVSLVLAVSGTAALRLEPTGVSPSLIGGYAGNWISGWIVGATIGGGGEPGSPNRVTSDFGTVAGGVNNAAHSDYATIGGGSDNDIWDGSWNATIGGGDSNDIGDWSYDATIGGGYFNYIRLESPYATIGGGQENDVGEYADHATVGGGGGNGIGDYSGYATIGGGYNGDIGDSSAYATIGGGQDNAIRQYSAYATIGGGQYISVTGAAATVAGGSYITVTADYATVGGGRYNTMRGYGSTIAGGTENVISDTGYSTIGGGSGNDIGQKNYGSTIGGGVLNYILGDDWVVGATMLATIGGGGSNHIGWNCDAATIGGGSANYIENESQEATIGGGYWNHIYYSLGATIGGGTANDISAGYATISGGFHNLISRTAGYATIPGGEDNEANAPYAFAAGRRAKANQQGAFVWADSSDFDFSSVVADSFNVRATGGVTLVTGIDGSGVPNAGAVLLPGAGSWSVLSDRALKENLVAVDAQELLARLAEIPISTWNYKAQDGSILHMGPMAQDFYAAFGLGESQRHISTVDADGVALAAIQGLYAQNQELEQQVDTLQRQNADLEARLVALERGGVAPSSSLGLPTWLLLGGLVLVGGVVLRLSLRDCVRAHRQKRSPGERNDEQQLSAEGSSPGPRAIRLRRIALLEMVCVSWERLLGRRGGGGAG